jgi:predicted amidohydrolase
MPGFSVKAAELTGEEGGFSVGLANLEAAVGDVAANRERIRQALASFRDHGVNLAVFPELCLSGNFWEDEISCRRYMEVALLEHQRDFIENTVRPAMEGSLRFIVLNLLRRADLSPHAPLVNSTVVIGRTPAGRPVEGVYDKTFLPGIEKRYLASGGGRRMVLETGWGRLGFLTCYDLCFPLLLLGYQLIDRVDGIIVSSSWRGPAERRYQGLGLSRTDYYGDLWEMLAPAQAAAAQVWLFAANAVGRHSVSGAVFWGGSGVWAPSGYPLLRAGHDAEELLVLKNVPLSGEINRERADFDYLSDFEASGLPLPALPRASVIEGR